MNKIIIVMQKVKIVSFFLIFISIILSCSEKNNDTILLELILKDSQYQIKDSFCLTEISDNTKTIEFFRLRNMKTRKLTGNLNAQSHSSRDVIKNDSVIHIKLNEIIDTIKVTTNDYIEMGKGVNNRAELFLKDTFNYKKEEVKWGLKKITYQVYPENEIVKCRSIELSKPVYNLRKNKVIVFKKETYSFREFRTTIYLIEKVKNNWEIIFKQASKRVWIN